MKLHHAFATAAFVVSTFLGSNIASAYERWINVVNSSGVAIESIYITDVDTKGWGRDLLGEYIIRPGDEMTVEPRNPRGYCRFEILIVYENGYEERFYGINLCEETTLWA